ncbi:MAG: AI-2E family transporter [Clostridia bacterium]|nr:AI-2E family transporter [Clostridia bacterium]
MERKKWLRRKPESMLDWLVIVFAAITFYMVLNNGGYVLGLLQGLMNILTPFAAGVVIAYIINPVVNWSYKYICRSHPRLHWLAMLIGYIVAFLILFLLAFLIATQVVTAIEAFGANLSGYQANLKNMLLELQPHLPESLDVQLIIEYLDDLTKIVQELIKLALGSGDQIMGFFNNAVDTFVLVFTALASSVYLLTQKNKLLRHVKILTRAFLPRRVAANVLRICQQANRNLTGFFTGKIIDSAIIGLLTFVCMTIFGMHFAPVISIIVGITNIIPVFGPFIGAVPGILILLFIEPMQALGFAVLILIIQQLDGNVIGPKILGDSIGISALWVLVAIVVGGDLFGLPGMVVGVPVFATLLSIVKEFAEWCLRYRGIDKEGNPTDGSDQAGDSPSPKPEEPAAPAKPLTPTQQRMKRRQNLRS